MDTVEKLEKRIEKVEDRVTLILQEIATFKPILETMNNNIKKISDNSIDKERVEKLEDKVESLENELNQETIEKKAKLLEEIIKYIILAILGVVIGHYIK